MSESVHRTISRAASIMRDRGLNQRGESPEAIPALWVADWLDRAAQDYAQRYGEQSTIYVALYADQIAVARKYLAEVEE